MFGYRLSEKQKNTMDYNFKTSIDRAIKLLGTPSDYENYITIKIKPAQGGCCCSSHCWPKTYAIINEYINPFGPIKDGGDALIGIKNEQYVLECHESGPEIVLYGIVSGVISNLVVELIKTFLKNLQNEDRKRPGSLKIMRRRQIKGRIQEEEIIEVDLPLSKNVIKKLNDNIKKAIEKR